jgi:hypothetical protein
MAGPGWRSRNRFNIKLIMLPFVVHVSLGGMERAFPVWRSPDTASMVARPASPLKLPDSGGHHRMDRGVDQGWDLPLNRDRYSDDNP